LLLTLPLAVFLLWRVRHFFALEPAVA
jgi:hypothetical protein